MVDEIWIVKENMENLDLYIFQIKMSYVWVLRWIIMVIGYWIKNGNVRDKTETPETIMLCWSCWSYFIIFTIIYSLIGISSPTHSMKFCVSSSIIVHVLGLFLEPKGLPICFLEKNLLRSSNGSWWWSTYLPDGGYADDNICITNVSLLLLLVAVLETINSLLHPPWKKSYLSV